MEMDFSPQALVQQYHGVIFGTAWKGSNTSLYVTQAIESGFRAIDTAAQPKHYREDLVGEGIRSCIKAHVVSRSDLFIQTKFTPPHGQDSHRIPYDPATEITTQVKTSIASSLLNLRSEQSLNSVSDSYIDSLILHTVFPSLDETMEAWRALSTFVPGSIRVLGISNVNLPVLSMLYDCAEIKPVIVQNRFYSETQYDREVRSFCNAKGILYEGFWVLTKNADLLRWDPVQTLAQELSISREVSLYALVIALSSNTAVLDGTRNEHRMREDVEGLKTVAEWSRRPENADWQCALCGNLLLCWKALEKYLRSPQLIRRRYTPSFIPRHRPLSWIQRSQGSAHTFICNKIPNPFPIASHVHIRMLPVSRDIEFRRLHHRKS